MSAYENLVEALQDKGLRGRGHYWRCPAHEDRLPSLAVREGDGRALVFCHAGCSVAEVVEALGLEMGDLFDEGVAREPRERTEWEERFRDWPAHLPRPLPPEEPPLPYFEVDGERVWKDPQSCEVVPEPRYSPTAHEAALEAAYPKIGWMLVHPPEERFFLKEPYLATTRRVMEGVPEWVLTALRPN